MKLKEAAHVLCSNTEKASERDRNQGRNKRSRGGLLTDEGNGQDPADPDAGEAGGRQGGTAATQRIQVEGEDLR